MKQVIKNMYVKLFARKIMYKFNRALYFLSLNGMGILNYKNNEVSGELNFIKVDLKSILSRQKESGDEMVIFDIGANVGNYALMLKKYHEKAKIFCFEPHPKTYKTLEKNIHDTDILSFELGCSDMKDKLRIYDYKYNDGSAHASIYRGVIEDLHKSESEYYEIEVVTLDEMIENLGVLEVDLLKIDTEGNELKVLEGSKGLINQSKIRVIHFEFNEMNVYSNTFFKEIVDLLPNFEFYRMLPDGLVKLGPYKPLYYEIFAFQNIVAVNKEPCGNRSVPSVKWNWK